jgi:hypothetical protein
VKRHFAWFITPHGFGHAARSCAIMEALRDLEPQVEFEIYTLVPKWFFQDSLGESNTYHKLVTDVGLVQNGPFDEDLGATLTHLGEFLPFSPDRLENLAAELKKSQVDCVISDISPLGIAAAHCASLPSALIENFTWDWIYKYYLEQEPGLAPFISLLTDIYRQADRHIQTAPECAPLFSEQPLFPPASRKPRHTREETRRALGISDELPAVLVSFGGIPITPRELDRLDCPKGVQLIIPLDVSQQEPRGNCLFLPHHSPFYHPDLVCASDAIVGKVGYSTLAEAYLTGLPFGYIARSAFPESPALVDFLRKNMPGFEIDLSDFQSGAWTAQLPRLHNLPRSSLPRENGAKLIAASLLEWSDR